MGTETNRTLAEIALAQNPKNFRRDQSMIPNSFLQLQRINKQLRELQKFPMCKKQAE